MKSIGTKTYSVTYYSGTILENVECKFDTGYNFLSINGSHVATGESVMVTINSKTYNYKIIINNDNTGTLTLSY